MTNIVDEADGCRACLGTGNGPREETQRGTFLSLDCYLCGGTGFRTVRISPTKPEKGTTNETV